MPSPGAHTASNSFSSPLVAGIAAQLMQHRPSLKTNPTLVKSLIMSGANGMRSSDEADPSGICMDKKYGAGVVNACNSYYSIATATTQKTYTRQYDVAEITTTTLTLLVTDNTQPVRLALNWQRESTVQGVHITGDNRVYTNTLFKLRVISPNGEEYTSFDVDNTFQLLEFTPPSDDMEFYTVVISRHGPTAFITPVSLSVFNCSTMY